jgi:murein DD-endopeptidase MepM/ murein hydrolase activator NlpD
MPLKPLSSLASGSATRSTAGLYKRMAQEMGSVPALISGNGRRPPDRRRVSLRWLFGSVLVGCTSILLMGGALYAALDGREQLADPAAAMDGTIAARGGESVQGDRLHTTVALRSRAEKIMEVPTLVSDGDSQIIRKRPFAYASAPLAIEAQEEWDYPAFNPLTVFRSAGDDALATSSEAIYGADIENEVRVKRTPFPITAAAQSFDTTGSISDLEAERTVRAAQLEMVDGEIQVAALPYLDDTRFTLGQAIALPELGPDVIIVAANVSTKLPASVQSALEQDFREDVISVPVGERLTNAIAQLNLAEDSLSDMKTALAGELGAEPLSSELTLRVAYEVKNGEKRAQRISVYRDGTHLASIAARDTGRLVWGNAPAPIPAIASQVDAEEEERAARLAGASNMPRAYDGIYRAALSQGLSLDHARRVVRTVAFDVDFRARVQPGDGLEVFYAVNEDDNKDSQAAEILHISLAHGGETRRYYRFASRESGAPVVDFYDENGRSAKKFLLRKPVPNGRFNSPFGPRRHPISRRVKMHEGVDFAAPRGTPILAAGAGVVEKADWHGGNGRFIRIRHANGYKTSYSHQTRFARGIAAGTRVRQGQIIGYVGSTGYSTGPHLHYEVIVNGNKVNPMKIRLPRGQVLKGLELAAFKRERDRIDALMDRGRGRPATEIAGL